MVSWPSLYIAALLWGVGDSSWNSSVSASVGVLFRDDNSAAFSNFQMWGTITVAITYASYSFLSGGLYCLFLLVFLIMGLWAAWKTNKVTEAIQQKVE
jgi:hypothetical protein